MIVTEIDKEIVAEELRERCYDLGYTDDRLVDELVREAFWDVDRNGEQLSDAIKYAQKRYEVRPSQLWCPVCRTGRGRLPGHCHDCGEELQDT